MIYVSRRQRTADTEVENSTADMLGVPVGAGPAEEPEQDFQSLFINAKPQSARETARRGIEDSASTGPHLFTNLESAVTPSERTMQAGKAEKPAQQIEAPARSEKKRTFSSPNVKPSKQTLDAAKDTAQDENIEQPVKHSNITPRERVMLLVYVVIAAVLAIAVIATGVSIASASSKASALAESVAQKQELVVAQESSIAELTDAENIRARAIEELGMIYTDEAESVTVSAIDKVEYPEPTPHTNSFDKFSKWLSQIIA